MKIQILLISLFLLSSLVYGQTSCSARWQCLSVSNDWNFVDCIGGVCTCLKNLGFSGAANSTSKCSCSAPGYVTWKDGTPFCTNLANCVASDAKNAREELLKNQVRRIYNNLLGITPFLISAGVVSVDDLFVPTARGRVTPLGNFNNFVLPQYFYILAAIGNATGVNIINLVAEGNVVTVRADVTFFQTSGLPTQTYNMTQTGFFYFDSSNRVAGADLAILNLGELYKDPALQQPFTFALCSTINGNPGLGQTQGSCNGANQQFASFNDCVTFMNSIPFGSYHRANSNTVACRTIHQAMTLLAPPATGANIHCPHAGPTGGGVCIDFPYESFWTNDIINVWA